MACLFPAICPAAHNAKDFAAATLVETADYLPCGERCSALDEPASAFCFQQGDRFLVAEGKSYFHERKFNGAKEFAGEQTLIRFNQRSLWVMPPDGPTVKLARGSRYENFKNSACVREVHQPILAAAHAYKRPQKLPAEAFALANSSKGDPFLWFQCGLDAHAAVIACRSWYRNGDFYGKDWYCAHTVDGKPIAGADFSLDPLLSRAGRLVLKSGAVVQHDNRQRTGDQLDRPGEACR